MVNGRPRRTEPLRAQRSVVPVHPQRTEPLRAERITPVASSIEAPRKRSKTWGKAAQLMMAASCVIAPIDLAVSDSATAKVYQVAQDKLPKTSDGFAEAGKALATGGFIMGTSLALGQGISRNKKLRDTFEIFDDYSEQAREKRGPLKKALFFLPTKLSNRMQTASDKAEAERSASEQKHGFAKQAGKLTADLLQVNTIGTSGVIMKETVNGKPTPFKRQAYLGGLITGSWLGGAEAVRQIYRHVPEIVQIPMATVGESFKTLTDPNFFHPTEAPIGTAFMGAVVLGFAKWGMNIEAFRQQREELLHVDHDQIQTDPLSGNVSAKTDY